VLWLQLLQWIPTEERPTGSASKQQEAVGIGVNSDWWWDRRTLTAVCEYVYKPEARVEETAGLLIRIVYKNIKKNF